MILLLHHSHSIFEDIVIDGEGKKKGKGNKKK